MPTTIVCPQCGHAAQAPDAARGRTARCPSCRASFTVSAPPPLPAPAPASAEQTFFSEGTVTITSARIVAGPKTYALANVTSVERCADAAHVGPLAVGMLLGTFAFCLLIGATAGPGEAGVATALVFLFGGVFASFAIALRRKKYAVVLRTTAGEIRAFGGLGLDRAKRIADAIGSAIAARG